MTAKYYWLQLKKDFFKRHDIQIIEAMPNGKDYVLFYLKLLLESLAHNGYLRFNELVPYNESMLATITNTNIDVVKSAMQILIGLKMIEILDDQTIYMAEVQKMLGAETYWAGQKRKQRNQEKQQKIGQCPTNVLSLSNVSNIEIDIEKDIDIDIEIKKDIDKKNSEVITSVSESIPYQEIMQQFNQICNSLSKIRGIEGPRRKAVAARWKSIKDIEIFITLFHKTEASNFLSGRSGKDWRADFDWLMKPQNVTKVLEGVYDNKGSSNVVNGDKTLQAAQRLMQRYEEEEERS